MYFARMHIYAQQQNVLEYLTLYEKYRLMMTFKKSIAEQN